MVDPPVAPVDPRRPASRHLLVAALVLTGLVASACGTSGRVMRPPPPGATAPTTATTPTTAGAALNTIAPTASLFVLSSSSFTPGATLPKTYSCDGAGLSPPLEWSNVPAGTVELVLVISDPDAKDFVQWMVAGLKPTSTGIASGAKPAGAVVLANSNGTHAYSPPCPPAGQTHSYEFTLYPLKVPSGLTADSNTGVAIARLDAEKLFPAVLTADYTRAKS
jgi:Raf kinase inhibitor-like YbhB/YbcL family protein